MARVRGLLSAVLLSGLLTLFLGLSLGLSLGEGALGAAVACAATAAVGAAVLGCAALLARCASPVPPTRIRTAIRDREQRTAFLPQRDPDASGRSRPRAPGRLVLTAA
ncbi:DUF6412 domain-containing protein [Streptomyces sp. G-G2]|uniref:DUF6412 domain-containing protein n=1 Tax=Streptomyces sp. G-G2 TaxID=3046201 RepID=UPI0024B8F77D|nr:DUF6412 domain-containing protein [Streptomyces sp. G-G2]MDJ0379650.1 DUF6412 domain-containing protein [Streptomyces sp. G-G2]